MDLPYDWAIEGPFLSEGPHGGMGRLPTWGVGWYRKQLAIPATDKGRSIFLDVDGAMSYATVWLNGRIVGGWPFGYASWRVDLTPYAVPGGVNQLAIRLDNPPDSSRWYPGGGIYRNVWLTKTQPHLRFDPDAGDHVNGERIFIKGVNQHHDLGALGAAFNTRAAERQLEILRDMGTNAIRTAHNPPAPELLELTDRLGFLVVDELFDVWERRKTPLDFHPSARDR